MGIVGNVMADRGRIGLIYFQIPPIQQILGLYFLGLTMRQHQSYFPKQTSSSSTEEESWLLLYIALRDAQQMQMMKTLDDISHRSI